MQGFGGGDIIISKREEEEYMKNKINIVLVVLLTVMTSVTIILALYAYVQKSNIDDLKQDLNNIKRNRLQ